MTESVDRRLRPYQLDAIAAWVANGRRGILAMATGTGKTFTALACVQRCLAAEASVTTVLIVAPFQHLVDQWAEELEREGIRSLKAYDDSKQWLSRLDLERHRSQALGKPLYIVTTYDTLGSDALIEQLVQAAPLLLAVFDECHYLGSPRTLPFMRLPVLFRLGLSATPNRHFDDEGTAALEAYFSGVVFEFDLVQAIAAGYLTPYDYYPEAVTLTDEEFESYRDLTARLGRAFARLSSSGTVQDDDHVQSLARKRARLLNNAERKVDWLRGKLQALSPDELRFTLVYVGDVLFKQVMVMIGQELGVPAHAFTALQSRSERTVLLRRFQAGELAVLVAMRCLDEGVDVPPTRAAYFLASSGNPREFVQRRGRILRTSPGKIRARVHDAIATPPLGANMQRFDTAERAAIRSQFARIREFGDQAHNAVEADRALIALRLAADLPTANSERERTR